MSIQLGDPAPDFNAETTDGPIRFHEWIGDSWAILFSHPADFTPVCTTELGTAAKLMPEFTRRNVKLIALSVDSVQEHEDWLPDIQHAVGTAMNFPIIADEDRRISDLYGMIHPKQHDNLTIRSVFVIDPQKNVRLTLTYPMSTGRNFDEILRVVDSLQRASNHPIATPADWRPGNEVIISPSVSDEDAAERFAEIRPVTSYLRYTPDPGA